MGGWEVSDENLYHEVVFQTDYGCGRSKHANPEDNAQAAFIIWRSADGETYTYDVDSRTVPREVWRDALDAAKYAAASATASALYGYNKQYEPVGLAEVIQQSELG